MKHDIQNQLYGVMHSDMVPVVPAFVPEFEVGSDSSLLAQMERAFGLAAMQKHSMEAARHLAAIMDFPPVRLEQIVADLCRLSRVQNINQKDETSIMDAVASAAVMMSARGGAQTAMEKLEGALKILSKEYQADW